MITIDKDIKITIDKADVPVFFRICRAAQRYLIIEGHTLGFSEEHIQEIHKFLNIIYNKVKL